MDPPKEFKLASLLTTNKNRVAKMANSAWRELRPCDLPSCVLQPPAPSVPRASPGDSENLNGWLSYDPLIAHMRSARSRVKHSLDSPQGLADSASVLARVSKVMFSRVK